MSIRTSCKWILTLTTFIVMTAAVFASGGDIAYNGNDNGKDVMLQAFTWDSANQNKTWYNTINTNAAAIGSLYTVAWLPPPNSSPDFSKQGYMPTDWYNLNNWYGTQAQLKTAIASLKSKNVKVLADIVVNHRAGMTQCVHGKWVNYTNPVMNGTNLNKGDGCATCSTGGYEGTWAYGGRTYNNDNYSATNDLDHWNADTRTKIKSWQTWLKNISNAGFDGWRYDFIRGFAPQHLGEYNTASAPYLSVGEFWKFENEGLPSSAKQALCDIVNQSGNKTMVFDFDLKRSLNNAFAANTFKGGALGSVGTNTVNGMIGWWSQAAVTFVDNHDTGWSSGASQSHWPLPCPNNGDLISPKAAYAFILTHPGIPNVYWSDWKDRGADMKTVIETLIKIRRSNGVTRMSDVQVLRAEDGLYAAKIGNVAIKIGNQGWGNYEGWNPGTGYPYTFTRYYNGGHAFCVYYKTVAQ